MKCANVLLEGENMRPRLADFGLFSLEGMAVAQPVVPAGTLRYMAPEALISLAARRRSQLELSDGKGSRSFPQTEGEEVAKAAELAPLTMDVYSFGCMVYEVAHVGTGDRRSSDLDAAERRRSSEYDAAAERVVSECWEEPSLSDEASAQLLKYKLLGIDVPAGALTADEVPPCIPVPFVGCRFLEPKRLS